MDDEKILTVQELVDELNKVKNKDLPVWTEGCDCDGEACMVTVERKRVYINRNQPSNCLVVDSWAAHTKRDTERGGIPSPGGLLLSRNIDKFESLC